MGGDPRFWNSLWLTLAYTASTVVLQVALGLSLALLVLHIPRGQAALRIAAILPIAPAPVVVGLFWRTLVLSPDVGVVDVVTRSLGLGSHNWLGDPQLALGDRDPHVAMDAIRVPRAAREPVVVAA